MSIEARMYLKEEQVDELEATICVTARLKDWKVIQKLIENDSMWPNWKFASAIAKVIHDFEKDRSATIATSETT